MLGVELGVPGGATRGEPPAWGLDLDFRLGRYSLAGVAHGGFPSLPGVAFSRTGGAMAQGLDGGWTAFAADAPRITSRGLLIEEGRTNVFLNSAAPDSQTITLGVGVHTLTVWGEAGSVTAAAGTATGTGFGETAASVGGTVRVLTISGAGTVSFTVSGAPLYVNVEAGAFGTSPILTGGSAATRGADHATVTGLGAIATAPLVLAVEADLPALDGVLRRLANLSDGSGVSNAVRLARNGANEAAVGAYAGGAAQATQMIADKAGARVLKIAVGVAEGVRQTAVDGVLETPLSVAAPSGLNQIDLGQLPEGAGQPHGWLTRVRITPGDWTADQVAALSA